MKYRRSQMAWRESFGEDVSIRFYRKGVGPPLILLHGLSGSVRWWRHNIDVLAETFTVCAVDLVHYRGRQAPKFVLSSTARRLAAWLHSLEFERAHWVGHSMGGAIAAQVAADYPECVDRLILIDPAVLFLESRLRISPWSILRSAPWFSFTLLPILFQDALRTGPSLLLRSAFDLLRWDLREKLPGIQAETLVIWGDRDGILPVRLAEKVCEMLPSAKFLPIRGAGHNPMWERPEEVNAAMLDFLRSS